MNRTLSMVAFIFFYIAGVYNFVLDFNSVGMASFGLMWLALAAFIGKREKEK